MRCATACCNGLTPRHTLVIECSATGIVSMKRIAFDLAKPVYQVAESVRTGEVIQRTRLNREVFARYVQEQVEPVE